MSPKDTPVRVFSTLDDNGRPRRHVHVAGLDLTAHTSSVEVHQDAGAAQRVTLTIWTTNATVETHRPVPVEDLAAGSTEETPTPAYGTPIADALAAERMQGVSAAWPAPVDLDQL